MHNLLSGIEVLVMITFVVRIRSCWIVLMWNEMSFKMTSIHFPPLYWLTVLKDGIVLPISKNHLVGGINCMRSLSDNENLLLLFLLIPSLWWFLWLRIFISNTLLTFSFLLFVISIHLSNLGRRIFSYRYDEEKEEL